MSRRERPLTATPSWGDRQSCTGKASFFDKRSAKRRASEIRKHTGEDLHAYRCTACAGWHLGHAAGQGAGVRHADLAFRAPARGARRIRSDYQN
jgi:hypothetical protein